MKVEREFVGFVLPFAVGIFLSVGIFQLKYSPLACSFSLGMSAIILMYILHPLRRKLSLIIMRGLISLLALSVGIFIGLSSGGMYISSNDGIFVERLSKIGYRMGSTIDSIAFSSPETAAILKALITGERGEIPQHVVKAFRESGAAHILSLSGFHLGIVYSIVRWSLLWMGNSVYAVRLRSLLTIIFCGIYTLATGAGPSIVRAFLFILLGEIARITHRYRSTSSLLFSALLIQLIIKPSSISSVGFQLSYAAMAGIAFIYPWLNGLWPGNPLDDRGFTRAVRSIWNSAAISISCQLTTGPLAYLYFNSFPHHFLLTNLIALPLTSLIIPFGILCLTLSLFGICPVFIINATETLISALSAALEIIAQM